MTAIEIAGRRIGPDEPVFIVAEMSANHLGDIERAKRIIDAARDAGADAIKLQTYRPDTITLDVRSGDFMIGPGSPWAGMNFYELYEQAYTPWEWHDELFRYAERAGLIPFSSPFDDTAVDLLERIGCPAYKIASFEITDIPLIKRCAATGKPLVISTGIAELADIELALDACREAGAREVLLMKCVSEYPASFDGMDLRALPTLAAAFGLPVGLSDHSPGSAAPVAAVALGAVAVEKHLTLSRADGGPDGAFSMEPSEFRAMTDDIRNVSRALGTAHYILNEAQRAARGGARSLRAARDIGRGEPLTRENVRSVRPAGGLHTRHLEEILGRRASIDIKKGTPLAWSMIGEDA